MNRNPKYFRLVIFIMIFFLAGCKKHEDITGDTTPPVISAVSVINISSDKVNITWNTDEISTSQVEYGFDINYGLETIEDLSAVTAHRILLDRLFGKKTYHYRVKSRDSSGNLSISDDYTFTTSEFALY